MAVRDVVEGAERKERQPRKCPLLCKLYELGVTEFLVDRDTHCFD